MKTIRALSIVLTLAITAACGKDEPSPVAGPLTEAQKQELAKKLVAPIDPNEFTPLKRGGGLSPVPPIHPHRGEQKAN